MFFDDPVRAFTNVRHALTTDGVVCWQGLHANEWLTLIADVVRRYAELPDFGGQTEGPGMFALCRPDEITTLLGAAGFDQVACDSYTPTILLAGGGNLEDSVDFSSVEVCPAVWSGFVDPSDRDDVLRIVQAELADRYEEGVGIRLRAAAWVVTAEA
jgi:hypothetical protein